MNILKNTKFIIVTTTLLTILSVMFILLKIFMQSEDIICIQEMNRTKDRTNSTESDHIDDRVRKNKGIIINSDIAPAGNIEKISKDSFFCNKRYSMKFIDYYSKLPLSNCEIRISNGSYCTDSDGFVHIGTKLRNVTKIFTKDYLPRYIWTKGKNRILVQMFPSCNIQGKVLDSTGNHVSGAKIFLYCLSESFEYQKNHTLLLECTTNRNGVFSYSGIPACCKIEITIITKRHPRYCTIISAIEHRKSREISIILPSCGNVSGIVVDQYGKPVKGANVVIMANGIDHFELTSTGEYGDFMFSRVPLGRILIEVSCSDKTTYLEKFCSEKKSITVKYNDFQLYKIIPVIKGRWIRGLVIGQSGNGLPGINIRCKGASECIYTRTDENGVFVASPLAETKYEISIIDKMSGYPINFVNTIVCDSNLVLKHY